MPESTEKQPTFEESLAQLEAIVSAIEGGKVGLQDAIAQYEKGMALVQRCRDMLADAEAKVQQLQLSDENRLTRAPLELPESDKPGQKS